MGKLDGIHPDPWQLVAELRAKYEKLSAENERMATWRELQHVMVMQRLEEMQ